MAFTVTATATVDTFNGIGLGLKVLTGATAAGGASATYHNASAGPAAASLTPNFSSSLVVWAVSADESSVAFTAAANNALYESTLVTVYLGDGHYSGTVTSGTPITCGTSLPSSAVEYNAAVYEVPASGGSTPALDGSTPAYASTTSASAITTASFTPPAGSVLVACVEAIASGSGSGQVMTITDTSGLGLVWTKRAGTGGIATQSEATYVYTATIPGGGGGGSQQVRPYRGGQAYRRRKKRQQQQVSIRRLSPE